MSFARLYGDGAIAGFTPDQVDGMLLWQFLAAREGVRRFHGGAEKPPELSDAALAEMGVEGF